jgi:hypothetical protein
METFSEKTPSIQEILKWSHSKRMNPRTNRKIKNKGRIYTLLQKKYDEYFPNNYTYLDSVENKDPVSLQDIWLMKDNTKVFVYHEPNNLIMYKDDNNLVHCFEKETIQYLKHHKINQHPITFDTIPRYVFQQVEEKEIVVEKTIKQRSLEVFQIFTNISIFIDYEDFLQLNQNALDKLYYETHDFYVENIISDVKIKIEKKANEQNKSIYALSSPEFVDLSLEEKQNYILDSFESLLEYKEDNINYMANYIILGGLGLVIPSIRNEYPDFSFQFLS